MVCTALAVVLLLAVGQATPSEKDARTPAQQKINSQLLYEIYRVRGEAEAKRVPPGPTGVRIDARKRAYVDIRAEPTPALQKRIRSLNGTIVSIHDQYHSVLAWVPLTSLERLAQNPGVRAIEPVAESMRDKNETLELRRTTP